MFRARPADLTRTSSLCGELVRNWADALGRWTSVSITTLGISVLIVLCQRAQKEVVWTNTRRVVASMTHSHIVRDRSVSQLPRKARCSKLDTSMLQPAVTTATSISCPRPAPISLRRVDMTPKHSHKFSLSFGRYATSERTVFAGAMCNPGTIATKGSAALQTRQFNHSRQCTPEDK